MSVLSPLGAVVRRTWLKTARRPIVLMFSLAQPLIWMIFFSSLMQRLGEGSLPSGVTYVTFVAPGICGMTVLMGASQSGIGLVRDVQTGMLQRILATPAPRWTLHWGKMLADATRLMGQAVLVLGLAILVGANVEFEPLPLLSALCSLFLFAIAFSGLSCLVALRTRAQESMAVYVHLVNMPLFFTSTALVPTRRMPDWIAEFAVWNPLSMTVNELRWALTSTHMAADHGISRETLGTLGLLTLLCVLSSSLAMRELELASRRDQ